jgi:hypothetical protein
MFRALIAYSLSGPAGGDLRRTPIPDYDSDSDGIGVGVGAGN